LIVNIINIDRRPSIERSLVLVKPDATSRGLTGAIISRLEDKGLRLAALKMLHMDQALARKHYDVHEGKPFFEALVSYITSGPIVAAVFEGGKAVDTIRQAMGATDPAKAATGTIRHDFGRNIEHNSVHGSDSVETAEKEIKLFFKENEIY
jgi:nucleoside-diphosphate kinase